MRLRRYAQGKDFSGPIGRIAAVMRRFLIIVALVVVATGGAWTIAWHIAAQQLIAGVERWAQQRRDEGWQVSYGSASPAGFPDKLGAQLSEPVLQVPARGPGGVDWSWRAPSVRVEVVPWRLDRITLRNRGANQVSVTRDALKIDGTLDCDDVLVRLEAGRRDGGRDGGRYLVELGGPKLRLSEPPVTAEATQFAVDLRLYRVPPGDHQQIAADLGLGINNLVTGVVGAMQNTPMTANLHANLMGAIPAGPLDQAVAAWRDDGGTLEVRRLTFAASHVNVLANGTLALDNQMRPMGAASAAIRGFDEALDRLTRAGTVNPRDAQLAKLMLSAIAQPNADGERVLNVPITGQNGWLYVGPMRLTRLDPLKLR